MCAGHRFYGYATANRVFIIPVLNTNAHTERATDGQTDNVNGIVGTIIIDKHPTKKKQNNNFLRVCRSGWNAEPEFGASFFPSIFFTFQNWLRRCGYGINFDGTSLYAQMRIIIIPDGRPFFEETQFSNTFRTIKLDCGRRRYQSSSSSSSMQSALEMDCICVSLRECIENMCSLQSVCSR